MTTENERQSIVLGGGCFWCVEACFNLVDGVTGVRSGYAGGAMVNPCYEEVCRGATGHAEVVKVEFDPSVVSLEELLEMFFSTHDPTTPNRQGHDVGTQYRSIILYDSEEQREAALKVIEELKASSSKPIVTEVAPLDVFYPAEDYHHQYFEKHPSQAYCRMVVAPKVAKARKELGLPA